MNDEIQKNTYIASLTGKPVLDEVEFSALLGISRMSLYRMTKEMLPRDRPPFFGAGGSKCIVTTQGLAWIEAHAAKHPWKDRAE